MDARLNMTIARIRRDIRHLSKEMLSRIDADEDCSEPAQKIMRAQTDLRRYLAKREADV